MVDMLDSKSSVARHGGSSPPPGKLINIIVAINCDFLLLKKWDCLAFYCSFPIVKRIITSSVIIMMIAQSRRTWIIAKLAVFVLVVLGYLWSTNESYAIECVAPAIDNGQWRCITPIEKITPKDPCTVSNPDPKLCQARKEMQTNKTEKEKRDKCDKTYWEKYCQCKYDLKWIYLNTEVPFIGDPTNKRCLVMSTAWSAPVNVLRALTKILMTFVMIGGFGMIVWWGVQIAWWDVKWGKDKIIWVAVAFALLWSLWVILRFINPNFFS